MAFIDYYKILGVDKNIPQKDIRSAYRKRAKQFHPDLHPNDPKAKAKLTTQRNEQNTINMVSNGAMLMLTNRLEDSAEEQPAEAAEVRLKASTSTVSAAEAVVSAASSRTYSVAGGVVHRALALARHTADRTLGRWKLLLASTCTRLFWAVKWSFSSQQVRN